MNIEIASRLAKLRKEKGFSQEDLADKLGISRQAVSKWERAEASPDTDNLILLARLYDVSLDTLLSTDAKDEEIKTEVVDSIKKEEDDKHEHEDKEEAKSLVINIIRSVYTLLVVIAYLLIGFLAPRGVIRGWLVFLTIPIVFTLITAIEKKNANLFAFPVVTTLVFLSVGMLTGVWHPTWIVFLLIPVYYSITGIIHKANKEKK